MSKKPKQPKEWVPEFSADFIIGYTFLHHALKAMSCAFMEGGK